MIPFDPNQRRGNQQVGPPPWHMWGSSVQLRIVAPGGVGFTDRGVPAPQVARINYRRPETWRFFLGGRLTGGPENLSGISLTYRIRLDLILGVGRSSVDTTRDPAAPGAAVVAFAQFDFTVPNTERPGQQLDNVKYTTAVQSPPMRDGDAASIRVIDHIVAQDIQCVARMVGPSPVTAEATAYFAPNVHVRPDWFGDSAQFLGSEVGGT